MSPAAGGKRGKARAKNYWDREIAQRSEGLVIGRGDYSPAYNRWLYQSKERALTRLLKKQGVTVAGARVLDVGSGLGYWAEWYLARGAASVIGIDYSLESVQRLAETFPDGTWLYADITKNIGLRGQFDIVSVMDVMYHIASDEDFERGLSNVSGRVRPGGVMIVTDRLNRREQHATGRGCWRGRSDYEPALNEAGLDIVEVRPITMLMNSGLHDVIAHPRRILSRPVSILEERTAPLLYALDSATMLSRLANLQIMLARRRDT